MGEARLNLATHGEASLRRTPGGKAVPAIDFYRKAKHIDTAAEA